MRKLNKESLSPTRRRFLKGATTVGAGAILSAGPFVMLPRKAKAAERIFITSWGGSYGEFVQKHLIEPFTAETGIEAVIVNTPDLAKVKAQVKSGNTEWDVFDAVGSMLFSGAKEDLWEPLDTNIVDLSSNSIPADPARGGMPLYIYSGGVAWDPDRTKNPPKNFREMWDTGTFPGRRALRTRASEMLEVALLADGVKPSEMYPLDIDRAFNSLESIKPHVRKWFDQTGQMVTLIQQNETDFTYAYTNRVRAARKAGVSIDISFDQLVNAVAYYAVIRGTPRREAAMRFLAFVARPEQQAAMAEHLSVSPAFEGADSLISEDARKWKADVTDPNSIVLNDEYWGDKYGEVNKRFKEWILI